MGGTIYIPWAPSEVVHERVPQPWERPGPHEAHDGRDVGPQHPERAARGVRMCTHPCVCVRMCAPHPQDVVRRSRTWSLTTLNAAAMQHAAVPGGQVDTSKGTLKYVCWQSLPVVFAARRVCG